MHDQARAFIAKQAAERGPFKSVLEVGSRYINGTVRDLFPDAKYLGIDTKEGPLVDVVADAAGEDWKPKDRFAAIVSCEVFEHEPRWRAIVANMARWLAPKGVVMLTMATHGREPHSGFDGGPVRANEQYMNVGADELVEALHKNGFEYELDTTTNQGDLYAVAWKPAVAGS
jgi:SAM-dependent methyltransferase